jgi:hypothetical protein
MRYIKLFEEHFNEEPGDEKDEWKGYKIEPSLQTREEVEQYSIMLEKAFTGLGLDVSVTIKDAANCLFKWVEVVISMNLSTMPFSLLSLMLGYLNPSDKWTDRDSTFFKLKDNRTVYGRIADGKHRVLSFKLAFSKARTLDMLKIDDKTTWFLYSPTTVEEAFKLTIREFLKLVNSCSDTFFKTETGFSQLFGLDNKATIKGLRHFINGYLKGKLTGYDRKNIINSINRLSSNNYFYSAMEYQKKANPEIFNLLNIPDEQMNKGEYLKDTGFMDD